MFDRLFDWIEHNYLRATYIVLAVLVIVFGVGFCSGVRAGDLSALWTAPTTNTDGSAIPASGAGSISAHRIEWGSCVGTAFGVKAGEAVVPMPALTYTVTGLAPATYCLRAYARNTYGVESDPTGAVSKIIPAPKPNPPVLVAVNVLAFEVLPHPVEGTRLGRNVGTVPLGTACGADVVVQMLGGAYYEVPRDAVTLTKTPKSSVLVARCEVQS